MTNVYYVGSSGNSYKLTVDRMVRLSEANFHSYKWNYEGSELQFGESIDRFTKEKLTIEFEIVFTGSHDSRKMQIEALHADFERDIINKTPGRIVWGDSYLDGYAMESNTEPFDGMSIWTKNTVVFVGFYPFWIQEVTRSYVPISQIVTTDDKKYSYQYPYSYAQGSGGITISLDYYAPCDFKLVAWGACSEVYVTMGGNIYNVDYPVALGECMVIDSRQKGNMKGEAYVIHTNGETTNVFDYRNPVHSLFKKVPAGNITISYPRTYGLDITFFLERSEPIEGDTSSNYAAILEKQGNTLTALR